MFIGVDGSPIQYIIISGDYIWMSQLKMRDGSKGKCKDTIISGPEKAYKLSIMALFHISHTLFPPLCVYNINFREFLKDLGRYIAAMVVCGN